jgi:putative transposase
MARIARVIAPGLPHHVTQRGNRRQQTFFNDDDYQAYLALMSEWCGKYQVQVWSYCLMPNHVHLIAVPETEEGLARAIGEAHRRYTRLVNFRENWRGHLWQERFASFPMDERYLLAAARYVEMNPVAAGMTTLPEEFRWSSAAAHLAGKDDQLVKVRPLLDIVRDWQEFLTLTNEEELALLKKHERSGRPLGGISFVESLEGELERQLRPAKRGPKPKLR